MSGWDAGWGSGVSKSSGWGETQGSGWGDKGGDFSLPTKEENENTLSKVGGMDKEINEQEMIGAAKSLGISKDEKVTKDEFGQFAENLGFSEEAAKKIVDGAVEKMPEGMTGEQMVATIGEYTGGDGSLNLSDLEKHNKDLGKLGDVPGGGWA